MNMQRMSVRESLEQSLGRIEEVRPVDAALWFRLACLAVRTLILIASAHWDK